MTQQLNYLDFYRLTRSNGNVEYGFAISGLKKEGYYIKFMAHHVIDEDNPGYRTIGDCGDYMSVVPCDHVRDFDFKPDLMSMYFDEDLQMTKCHAYVTCFTEEDKLEVLAKRE